MFRRQWYRHTLHTVIDIDMKNVSYIAYLGIATLLYLVSIPVLYVDKRVVTFMIEKRDEIRVFSSMSICWFDITFHCVSHTGMLSVHINIKMIDSMYFYTELQRGSLSNIEGSYMRASCDLVQCCLYSRKHFSAFVARIEHPHSWMTTFSSMVIKRWLQCTK